MQRVILAFFPTIGGKRLKPLAMAALNVIILAAPQNTCGTGASWAHRNYLNRRREGRHFRGLQRSKASDACGNGTCGRLGFPRGADSAWTFVLRIGYPNLDRVVLVNTTGPHDG